MSTFKLHGRAFVDGAVRDDTLITVRDGVIEDVAQTPAPTGAERVDGLIVPGFVDVHVHGGDGADFMDGDPEANSRVLRFHAAHGTTALAATTLTASRSDLQHAVKGVAQAVASQKSATAEVCAVHLEGPYINTESAGAQDRASIRPADIQEIASLLDEIPDVRWIITIAPEIGGARALIEHYRGRVLFSVGHTAADYAETVAALEWGAAHFTHLFNAMTGMHHREPGVVGAALVSTSATAEVIADGVHVHPAVLRMAVMAMPNRVALVTDAMRAAGKPDGMYKLYGHQIQVTDGTARMANRALAGSLLTMNRAVQNMVELAGLPIESVIPLATEIPARILGVGNRKGKIEGRYDADLVVLTPKFDVERVWCRGRPLSTA
ncbi:MAG TPA: N-acetylglucosamine-6-phosphate deacetylase [Thermoanaerobaculia bacterium]|nr:N-acetylglucosamine-6-phosphate deacetylase [Thermoanaerobaculia bacterium]